MRYVTYILMDGLGDVNVFLNNYEEWVPKIQRLLALDITLKATPARWWSTHKNIEGCHECRRLMWIRFGERNTQMELQYDGETSLGEHIWLCTTTWKKITQQ